MQSHEKVHVSKKEILIYNKSRREQEGEKLQRINRRKKKKIKKDIIKGE